MKRDLACRLGVDVGGTFTDLVLLARDGRLVTRKVLSTSGNYAEAIFAGIADVLQEAGIAGGNVNELIHGTTVATNAIIERRGARTGLVTTEGFRDLLEIGRLRLMRLYDMDQARPPPLVRRRWRFEVAERLNHQGEVIRPLDQDHTRASDRRDCRREPRIRGRLPYSCLCQPRARAGCGSLNPRAPARAVSDTLF